MQGGNKNRRGGVKNLRGGRRATAGVAAGGVKKTSYKPPFQRRVAQNLVKRATLQTRQNRNATVVSRRGRLAMDATAAEQNKTQRLVRAMRMWKNKAQVLQTALRVVGSQQRQQRPRFSPRIIPDRMPNNSLNMNFGSRRQFSENRLGWRNQNFQQMNGFKGRRGSFRNFGGQSKQNPFGQMQSDLASREQARQQRILADMVSQSLMNNANAGRWRPNRGLKRNFGSFGGMQINRTRGFPNNQGNFRRNTSNSFGGTLNERFSSGGRYFNRNSVGVRRGGNRRFF